MLPSPLHFDFSLTFSNSFQTSRIKTMIRRRVSSPSLEFPSRTIKCLKGSLGVKTLLPKECVVYVVARNNSSRSIPQDELSIFDGPIPKGKFYRGDNYIPPLRGKTQTFELFKRVWYGYVALGTRLTIELTTPTFWFTTRHDPVFRHEFRA
jgi:hypothetical protein